MTRSNISSFFKKQLSFKKPLESLLFLSLVFFILFLINKYILPLLNLNIMNLKIENFENDNSKKLVYFYMNGCGHCEKFSPIWDKFSNSNASSITTHKLERAQAKDKLEKYNINGFPTILLLNENNEKLKDYNGDRSEEALKKFVRENE